MAWAMRKQCSMCFAADRSAALACRVTSVTKSRLKEICLKAFSATGVWFFIYLPPIVDGTGGADHSTRGSDRSTPLGECAGPLRRGILAIRRTFFFILRTPFKLISATTTINYATKE